MQIVLELFHKGIWEDFLNGPFVPINVINNMQEKKDLFLWTIDEERKHSMMSRLEVSLPMHWPWTSFTNLYMWNW